MSTLLWPITLDINATKICFKGLSLTCPGDALPSRGANGLATSVSYATVRQDSGSFATEAAEGRWSRRGGMSRQRATVVGELLNSGVCAMAMTKLFGRDANSSLQHPASDAYYERWAKFVSLEPVYVATCGVYGVNTGNSAWSSVAIPMMWPPVEVCWGSDSSVEYTGNQTLVHIISLTHIHMQQKAPFSQWKCSLLRFDIKAPQNNRLRG